MRYSRIRSFDETLSKEEHFELNDDAFVTKQSLFTKYRTLILAHIVLAVFYISSIAYLINAWHSCNVHGPNLLESPAWKALYWQKQLFVFGERKEGQPRYTGPPGEDVDQAWHDLLNNQNIRIEPDVMRRLGREDIGIKVPGEDAYLGTLNVFHELHCLKRLHQYMYQEHYFPNLTTEQREMNLIHNAHCIDFLRQSALCHADTGLITYEWTSSTRIPLANITRHQCVDWERLSGWVEERSVDMLRPGWLVHPTLGE
ncbi:hypothetical protein PRZ48_002096 [Zasmidium cellare]|uniref:Tat pathway signal sequence n=1 Tax=Zasmidium cellare TaxID=395010 RepID=A0ABR0F5T6_ZASCE|nr:hypothetical protein PRZ48_002096 [Zasmidium cellare]